MKNSTILYLAIGMTVLIGMFFLGRRIFPKCPPVDTTELDSIKVAQTKLREVYENKLKESEKKNDFLETQLSNNNRIHAEIRSRLITPINRDSLEKILLKKGLIEFGEAGDNPDLETALAYGNNFADQYTLQKKQLENSKVREIAYAGIVKTQDTIIQAQLKVIKVATTRKDRLRTKGGWFIVGYIAGLLTPG